MKRKVACIGAASGWGGRSMGCGLAPEVVRKAGLIDRLSARGVQTEWKRTVETPTNRECASEKQIWDQVTDHAKRLSREVEAAMADALPLVIGGDHSVALGTWNGVRKALDAHSAEPLGLIWIDAHMDAHRPETSPSGNLHGMPVAALLGYGPSATARMICDRPVIHPAHLVLIGVRSFEWQEQRLLDQLGVRVFMIEEVCERGLGAVVEEAVQIVTRETLGFGLSFDLDAADPTEAPGVSVPEANGLRTNEILKALALVKRGLRAVEIVEYNPLLDREEKTLKLLLSIIDALF